MMSEWWPPDGRQCREFKKVESGKASTGEVWAAFWSGEHAIYVNERHAQIHYQQLAEDITRLLNPRFRPKVLDWGCGDALNAPAIAAVCSELLLYDAVPVVQRRLQQRYTDLSSIRVLDSRAWNTWPPASLDVIIMNSVAQYLSRTELEEVMDTFRRVLRPDGEIIFADVIPPDAGLWGDIYALTGTGWRHGFFLAACVGLMRTFFSQYRQIRKQAGFSTYGEREFLQLLADRGFAGERLTRNVGFNQQRMTFRARIARQGRDAGT